MINEEKPLNFDDDSEPQDFEDEETSVYFRGFLYRCL